MIQYVKLIDDKNLKIKKRRTTVSTEDLVTGLGNANITLWSFIPRLIKFRPLKRALEEGPLVEAAKAGKIPRNWFRRAQEVYTSSTGVETFYDGAIGQNDIQDIADKVQEYKRMSEGTKTVKVYAKDISDAHMQDLNSVGAYVTTLLMDPSYSQIRDRLELGINVMAIFNKGAGFKEVNDAKSAEKDARKKIVIHNQGPLYGAMEI